MQLTPRSLLAASLAFSSVPFNFGFAAAAESQNPIRGTLRRVEVYPDGARITRLVALENIGAGSGRVEIVGIPLDLQENQIQVRPVEPGSLRIETVRFQRGEPDRPYETDDVLRLKEDLEKLRHEKEDLELARESLRERVGHHESVLASLRQSLQEKPDGEVLAMIEKAREAYLRERDQTAGELRKIRESERKLEEKTELATADLARARQDAQRISGRLLIEFDAQAAGPGELEVTYLSTRAGWRSHYRFRSEPAKKEMTVEWLAHLTQHTGEDWSGVPIVLSTARAVSGGDVPEVPPALLMPWQPMARGRAQDSLMSMSFAKAAVSQAESMPPPAEASVEAGMTQFRIRLPGTPTVSGRGLPAMLPVLDERTSATFWSEAAPMVQPTAYLQAEIENPFDSALLPGAADVYVDGFRTGQVYIQQVLPGEKVTLGLGRNENVLVERKAVLFENIEKGLIGKQKVYRRGYETSVENRMNVAHEVRVRDRFPVAGDAEIEVRNKRPANAEVEADTGRFTQTVQVKAGEKVTVATSFEVLVPADMEIVTDF